MAEEKEHSGLMGSCVKNLRARRICTLPVNYDYVKEYYFRLDIASKVEAKWQRRDGQDIEMLEDTQLWLFENENRMADRLFTSMAGLSLLSLLLIGLLCGDSCLYLQHYFDK